MGKASQPPVTARTYYRPIEAAIRWCGLLQFERHILLRLAGRALPGDRESRRWPNLRLNTERILDALAHGELPRHIANLENHSPAQQSNTSNDSALIVRHVDLKAWMARYYPGEKPSFLFDEIERTLHPAITYESLGILLAERDAGKARFLELSVAHKSLLVEHEALAQDYANHQRKMERELSPGSRSESTYLNIIGGLVSLLLGRSPSGTAYSSFRTMESVISALLAHHEHLPGISERTLWSKLAQARRNIEASG